MPQTFVLPRQRELDDDANPLAGALLYFFRTGTTTPQAVYSDDDLTTQHSHPVVADAAGKWPKIYLDSAASANYRVRISTAAGVQIYQEDDIDRFTVSTAEIGRAIYGISSAENAAAVTPSNYAYPPYHVDRYGAVGDGVTDDTAAIQRAINAARASGGRKSIQLGDGKTYLITSSLVLASGSLGAVDLVGAAPEWFGGTERSLIKGNFNGPLLNASGTAGGFSPGPVVRDVVLENLNTGTSACLLRADYSGGVRMYNVLGRAGNIGVYATSEMISPLFEEVCIYRPSGYLVNCYNVHSRNAKWIGGRAYSAVIALDVSGDTPVFYGLNVEFSQIVFRHFGLTGATFVGCHFETSQVLLTNASGPPVDITGAPYVDNASTGAGISGVVKFTGCNVALTNTQSNLVTIKSSGGFVYAVEFDSCTITATNAIIGNSFTPATSVALPAGTKVTVRNTTGLTVVKPPNDAFSGYVFENTGTKGGTDTNEIKILGDTLQTYTPTWASTGTQPVIGNGTITGHYMKVGNLYTVKIKLTMGSTTTYGTGFYSFSLPVSAAQVMFGTTHAVDTGTGEIYAIAKASGSSVSVLTTAGVGYSSTAPHTWANTDELEVTVAYFA